MKSWQMGAIAAAIAVTVGGMGASAATLPSMYGVEVWLDATDATTLTLSGSDVTQWDDKSGNGHHATPASGSPTLVSGAIGSQDAVRFNFQPLNLAGDLGIATSGDRTVVTVMNYSTLNNNSEYFGTNTGSMLDVGTWMGGQRLRVRNGGSEVYSPLGSVPTSADTVLFVNGNGSGVTATRNGATIIDNSATSAFGYSLGTGVQVGGANFVGREYVGDIAEMIVYDRQLNSYELNELGYALQTKYNLTGSFTAPTTPVTSGLTVWLDSSDASSLTVSSGEVTQWNDKSGNGHHATPLSNGPTLVENALNGRTALQFTQAPDGQGNPGQTMQFAGNLGIAANQQRTVFIVLKTDVNVDNNQVFGPSGNQMLDLGTWIPTGSADDRLRFRDGSDNVFSAEGDYPRGISILTAMGSATDTDAWFNGQQIVDSTTAAFEYALGTGVKLGGTDYPSATDLRNFEGLIAEVLIYDRALTADELNEVGYYLEQKYLLDTAYVPEPGTCVMLMIGAAGLMRRRR